MNPLITSHLSLIAIIRWRSALSIIALVVASFALAQRGQAVVPAPDGGYAGGNTAEGTDALLNLTGGVWETALGFQALNHDTAGGNNTATGVRALFSNTVGNYNTATGVYALYANVNGFYNDAIGAYALANNISGNYNTANGYGALFNNTTINGDSGSYNTATGFGALYRNTIGTFNTANGSLALNRNTTGDLNTANGREALANNTTGLGNTANGYAALFNNTTGGNNTANGYLALGSNTTGNSNTAIGYLAGGSITGFGNICIGTVPGIAGVNSTTWIANVYASVASGRAVFVDGDNKIGTLLSTRRVKDHIKPMDKASEAILALKPVTFRYKKEVEPNSAIQFGLIAEEVEEADPDLVIRDAYGKPESVRYEAVNAMLLNEFLKEHQKVEEQQAELEAINKRLREQETKMDKVSAHLKLDKPAPRIVVNKP